ncbi:chromodomain-helicase-DNA-binding protein [Thraustotheca clavata]|uniref:Chromodomain-helicase-DNA-binding protein n=1 Tax=Thraustotheca clavata TaxID=74557 RepID=A0A1V9ZZP1_9STRA|nr:chromodomain-helicase-DNA-binding protein [Thraustotheca clavata]
MKTNHSSTIAALEQDKQALKDALKEAKEARATAVAALHENTKNLELTLEELTKARNLPPGTHPVLEAENARLKENLEDLTTKLTALETAYKGVQDELSRESQRYAIELETANNFHKRFQNDLKKVTQERQELEKSLKTIADEHALEMEKLKAELEASQAELAKESQSFFLLKSSEENLKRKLETLEADAKNHAQIASSSSEELTKVQRSLDQKDSLLQQAHRELEREVARAALELEGEKTAHTRAQEELRKVVDDKAELIAKLKESMTKADELQAALTATTSSKDELDITVTKLRAEVDTSKGLLASLAGDYQSKEAELKQVNADAQSWALDKEQLIAELNGVKADYAELEKSHDAHSAAVASHNEQVCEGQALLEATEAKLKSLESTHEVLVKDKATVEATLNDLKEERESLLKASKSAKDALASSKSSITSLTAEVATLKQQLVDATNKQRALEVSHATALSTKSSKETQLENDLAAEKLRQTQAKEALEQATTQLKSSVDASSLLKTKISTLESTLKQKEIDAKDAKQTITSLRKEVAVLQVTNEKISAESKHTLAEAERLHAANDAIKEEWARFRKENGKLAATISELRNTPKSRDIVNPNATATLQANLKQWMADVVYCVCQQLDSAGLMIECIRGSGGCNGWVHPACCGLLLTEQELEAVDSYICPLCESPDDDFSKMTAVNTKRANKMALKAREKSSKKMKKDKKEKKEKKRKREKRDEEGGVYRWKCKACSEQNEPNDVECSVCRTPRKKSSHHKRSKHHDDSSKYEYKMEKSRRSHREGHNKSKYHVPDSDDDLSEAEVDFSQSLVTGTSSTTTETTLDAQQTVIMTIEKIMGHKNEPTLQFFIKWKGYSYMHASWETEETLLQIDPNNKNRIKRYMEKSNLAAIPRAIDNEDEIEYFNPEYLEIHRILESRYEDPTDEKDDGLRYFIKWRVLSYAECTWERACDIVDDDAIKRFRHRCIVPTNQPSAVRPSIRDFKKLEKSPKFGEDGRFTLRAYQLEGLNWLRWNWHNDRPSILADEMGLGKTIQTLAFLDDMRLQYNIPGPFLVVAPLSLIAQWQSECETWTDMDCVVYHGSSEARDIIQQYEFYHLVQGRPDKKKPFKFQILVTTYEIAIKDISLLSKIQWQCLVVDEAHRLKNQSSRLVEQMRSLKRSYCVLLTGTPLQNKTEELWALLNFLDPDAFPQLTSFMARFGSLQDANQVAELHKVLKPYLLRRVKEDVEKALPPKEETIIEVELTPVQKQWYRAIYERNTAFLMRGTNPSNAPNLMNVMMELRKCCNHPYLNNGVEEALCEGMQTDAERYDMLIKCCGKMVLLDKLLPRLKEGGHKVLIFSQMVRVLDLLEDYIRNSGYKYERLDGNIRGNERQAAVDRFVKPEYERFIMLLSTKAGGLGLNLTAADTVIIYDSDWNPQNDLQAQARAHRIGQTHSVKIYRLITKKTYEMHMFHKASLKLGLDRAVLTHMRQEQDKETKKPVNKSKAQEAQEIDELLKRGAYDVFRDEDDASEQFCSADIDTLLQRSSQIVQYEAQARGSFAKASFISAATADDVDIDDPDFWKKAVGLAEPEATDDAAALVISSQRKRTRVARFGSTKDLVSDDDDDDESLVKKDGKEDKSATQTNSSREWTINGRDRLQRALMHYGFGRWETIRSQSGGSRSVEEVETFARAFVLVCGLCCGGTTQNSDSSFVQSTIRTAAAVKHEYIAFKGDQETWTDKAIAVIPVVLQEEDFVSKLKQGGARRVLSRLDILSRLHNKINASCETIANQRSLTLPDDLDARVDMVGLEKLLEALDIANIPDRPQWSNLTSWWDTMADKCLCVGVFLHGYGRCSQIISDTRICFQQREAAFVRENSGNANDDGSQVDGDGESTTKPKFQQPEVQQMNRLLIWLLSIEDVQRQKQQEKQQKSSQEVVRTNTLEQSQKVAIQRRQDAMTWQLVHLELLRHSVYMQNKTVWGAILDGRSTQLIKEWSLDERKSVCLLLSLCGAPLVTSSSHEWSWLNVVDAAQVLKSAARAQRYVYDRILPRCKELISKDLSSASSRPNEVVFVDPYQASNLHGQKSKLMASLLLRRTQIYRTLSYIVPSQQEALNNVLRSGLTWLTDDMPAWWCPWIHDLALIQGMLRFGIGDMLQVHHFGDLHTLTVVDHVYKVFVESGVLNANGISLNTQELAQWIQITCCTFPTMQLLEQRVMRLCLLLTEQLPTSHDAKFTAEYDLEAILPMEMFDAAVKSQRTSILLNSNSPKVVEKYVTMEQFAHKTKSARDMYECNALVH